jgi:hypothetical protein
MDEKNWRRNYGRHARFWQVAPGHDKIQTNWGTDEAVFAAKVFCSCRRMELTSETYSCFGLSIVSQFGGTKMALV